MVFSSLVFLFIFFPLTLTLYFISRSGAAKNIILVIASLTFYSWGEPAWVTLLIFSSILDYTVSHAIEKNRGKSITKLFLAISIIVNLGLLAAFKYSGLFVASINSIFGLSIPVPEFALPIGISFYTFQTMSYSIDVYRGNVKTQKSFINLKGLGGRPLTYDFYIPQCNLLIEFQGKQHESPIRHFGGEKQFSTQQEHDKRKRKYAQQNNINLLEIWYYEIDNIKSILLQKITEITENNLN